MLKFLAKILPFERRSLSDPTAEEWAIFTGSASGVGGIGLGTALTLPAVQCAIRLISEAAAGLELKVMRREGDGWTHDQAHPVAKLLADQPNEWSSTFELIRDLVATALTHDKGGLAWVNRAGGEVREVIRYEPAYYQVDYSTDGRAEPTFRINNQAMDTADVIYLRSPFARSPLSLASEAIGAAKAMEKHARKLFENSARPGGVIEFPKPLGDDGVKRMKTSWREAHDGPDNSGRTAILWDGAKFTALTMNSTDAQFLENRKYQVIEIGRAFRVPPSMLYELDRATWSNGEQMGREFLVYSLDPWLLLLEAGLRRALFTPEERASYRILFDRDDLTRADLTARATAISSLVSARVLNPNEARGWLDLDPYTGGDAFANPHINPTAPGAGHNGGPPLDDNQENEQ